MDIVRIMLTSLICTIIIEVIIAYILKVRNKMDLVNILLVNLLTNPIVTSISLYINVRYVTLTRVISIIILELFAFITEALIYKHVLDYKKINPFLLSLILNFSSYFIGIFLNNILY